MIPQGGHPEFRLDRGACRGEVREKVNRITITPSTRAALPTAFGVISFSVLMAARPEVSTRWARSAIAGCAFACSVWPCGRAGAGGGEDSSLFGEPVTTLINHGV